jgi:hypothetical protein
MYRCRDPQQPGALRAVRSGEPSREAADPRLGAVSGPGPEDPRPEMTIRPVGSGLWKWIFVDPPNEQVVESMGIGSRQACLRDAKRFLQSRGLGKLPIHFKV